MSLVLTVLIDHGVATDLVICERRDDRRIIVNRRRQLELVEADLPNPGPGEVRLKMLAAGVSYPDVMMRRGIHPEARRPAGHAGPSHQGGEARLRGLI